MLVMMGIIPPRNNDEREMRGIVAAQPDTPRYAYQRSTKLNKRYRDYMRQYQRDHPRTWEQQQRNSARTADRRSLERFIRDADKWQKLFETYGTADRSAYD